MAGYNININAGTAGTAGELPNTNRYLERKFLDNLKQEFNILKYAKEFNIPSMNSKVIEFPKLTKLSAATTALQEGVPPAGSKLTVTKTTMTLYEYGDFVYFSDLMDETAELNYRAELTVEQSYQGLLTLETLVRNNIIAGTNVYYSNGSARTDVNSPITASIIRKAVRYMRRNNVKPLTGLLKGSGDSDAKAIKSSYGMFVHDDVLTDLIAMDEQFVDIEQYAGRASTLPNEIGAIRAGVRILENSLFDSTSCSFNAGGASYTATGMISAASSICDVYPSIVFTEGAYACAKLNKTNVLKYSKKRGSAGTGDPLDQISSEGWKILFGNGRHDETKLVRIESAATELV